MKAARQPTQRPRGAKLLAVDAHGAIRHMDRSHLADLLRPGDLVVANDAATLPASLHGTDARTGLWCIDLPDGEERLVVDPTSASDADLPAEERARRERVRETGAGVVAYSADSAGSVAVFATGGQLQAVDVATGAVRDLPAAGPGYDPRIDPTGARYGIPTFPWRSAPAKRLWQRRTAARPRSPPPTWLRRPPGNRANLCSTMNPSPRPSSG